MDLILANPRGFCAGVDRAIEIVNRALETLGAPIYVRHEVVHNKFVVDDLKQRGAIFVEELDEVPDGNTVIFSAHGVSRAVRAEADRRGLKVFDATCPLVTKVHLEVSRQCRAGRDMILIGHAGHPEGTFRFTSGFGQDKAGGLLSTESKHPCITAVVNRALAEARVRRERRRAERHPARRAHHLRRSAGCLGAREFDHYVPRGRERNAEFQEPARPGSRDPAERAAGHADGVRRPPAVAGARRGTPVARGRRRRQTAAATRPCMRCATSTSTLARVSSWCCWAPPAAASRPC